MKPTIRRILVPVDFSECSSAALDYAIFLARSFGATVDLLHVLEPLPMNVSDDLIVGSPPETIADRAWRITREEIERVAVRARKTGLSVTTQVDPGIGWQRIVHRAAGADLVVMGTHGRTGIARFLMGSVTDKVVQRSPVPVLTIRSAELSTAEERAVMPTARPLEAG